MLARPLIAVLLMAAACSSAIEPPDPQPMEAGVTFTVPSATAEVGFRGAAVLPRDALVRVSAWSSGPLVGPSVRVTGPSGQPVAVLDSRGTSAHLNAFRTVTSGEHHVSVTWAQGSGIASYRFDVLSTAPDPYRVDRLNNLVIAGEAAPRAGANLVTLPANGTRGERVLIVGGYSAGTVTRGGKLLVRGAAALLDPVTGASEVVGGLETARAFAAAVLITQGSPEVVGKVLVAGGLSASGAALASTELFDPVDGSFSGGPDLPEPRAFLTPLEVTGTGSFLDGKILLAGGELTRDIPQNDLDGGLYAEVDENPREIMYFDSTDASIRTITPKLTVGRVGMTPVLLSDGRILFIGGGVDTLPSRPGCVDAPDAFCRCNPGGVVPLCTSYSACVEGQCEHVNYTRKDLATASVDAYDTATGNFDELARASWLNRGRLGHAAVVLPGDRILVAGGVTAHRCSFQATEFSLPEAPVALDSVELFEPETGQWRILPPLASPREAAALVWFAPGDVALVGGTADAPGALQPLALVETYLRTGESFESRSLLGVPRYAPMVARVNAGKAWLVVGGEVDGRPSDAIELITVRPVLGEGPSDEADVVEPSDVEAEDASDVDDGG